MINKIFELLQKPGKQNQDVLDEKKYNPTSEDKLRHTQAQIRKICKNLCVSSAEYDPESTTFLIVEYLTSREMDRVLYSEFSKFIFDLNDEIRGQFETNVEMLMYFVLDDDFTSKNVEIVNIVTKIYDHFQLVISQVDNVKNIATKYAAESKEQLNNELKGVEKDYISILSIFSAVIMTFFGGFNYIASALSSLNEANMFKSAFAISLSGLVTFNMIYVMIKMIGRLVKHEFKSIMEYDKISNYVYVVNLFLVIAIATFGFLALYYPSIEQNIFLFP